MCPLFPLALKVYRHLLTVRQHSSGTSSKVKAFSSVLQQFPILHMQKALAASDINIASLKDEAFGFYQVAMHTLQMRKLRLAEVKLFTNTAKWAQLGRRSILWILNPIFPPQLTPSSMCPLGLAHLMWLAVTLKFGSQSKRVLASKANMIASAGALPTGSAPGNWEVTEPTCVPISSRASLFFGPPAHKKKNQGDKLLIMKAQPVSQACPTSSSNLKEPIPIYLYATTWLVTFLPLLLHICAL